MEAMDWLRLIEVVGIFIAAVSAFIATLRSGRASQDSRETKQMVQTVLQQVQKQQQQQHQSQKVFTINVGQLYLGSEGAGQSPAEPLNLGDSPPVQAASSPEEGHGEASQ